jgi:hypothetical protein
VGLDYTNVAVTCCFCSSARLSSGNLVLVCEAAEDLLSADPVLGEVDLRWPGVSLSRWQLAQGAVRPGCVAVDQVSGQYPAQVMLIDDQQPAGKLPAQGTDDRFADGVRSGRLRRAGQNLMPSAVNTVPEDSVNCPARSLIRNLTDAARWPRSIRKLRAA